MSLLRLNVLGPPEVYHDGSRLTFALRKAQALLLYLAVEGGLHPRSKLAAFLWPDSDPHNARTSLRNAITLLRRLLADLDPSPAAHSHLLNEDDLWLAELSRLLPELRVRYPDLPAPTEDELTAKIRLFEAVARLVDALAQRAPLVLLLDDLSERWPKRSGTWHRSSPSSGTLQRAPSLMESMRWDWHERATIRS